MLVFNLEQGTEAWLKLRLGIPTTSNFSKIITPTGKKSTSYKDYLDDLLAQIIFGRYQDAHKSDAMMRGNELEPMAVECYASITSTKPKEVGFITTKDGRIGCSPDRLIGDYGLLEVKCPLEKQHSKNLRTGVIDSKYYPQVQGQIAMTGRKWCDWMSFHPEAPPSIVRVERDDEYIEKMLSYINSALDEQDDMISVLRSKKVPIKIELKERDHHATSDQFLNVKSN